MMIAECIATKSDIMMALNMHRSRFSRIRCCLYEGTVVEDEQ